jgi:hypothetical protein
MHPNRNIEEQSERASARRLTLSAFTNPPSAIPSSKLEIALAPIHFFLGILTFLIDSAVRLEIAAIDTKQRSAHVSNRNSNGYFLHPRALDFARHSAP